MARALELFPEKWLNWEPPSTCHDFGLTPLVVAGIEALGIGAETATAAAPIVLGVGEGAAGGAGLAAATGGNPLLGAAGGAVGGGIGTGFAGPIGAAVGDETAGGIIAGGLGGAAGTAITGGNPILGAAGGAVLGSAGAFGGGGGGNAPFSAGDFGGGGDVAAPAASAASIAAPITSEFNPSTMAPNDAFGTLPTDRSNIAAGTPSGGAGDLPKTSNIATGTDNYINEHLDYGGGGDTGIGKGIIDFIKKNPGVLLGGGLLGFEAMRGQHRPAEETSLQQLAAEARGRSAMLAEPAITGVLPPGEEAAVRLATESARAKEIGTFGNLGLSGSTMEAQALGGVDLRGAALRASIANQLLSESGKFSALAGEDIAALLKAEVERDKAFQGGLNSFIGGLAGLRTPQAT